MLASNESVTACHNLLVDGINGLASGLLLECIVMKPPQRQPQLDPLGWPHYKLQPLRHNTFANDAKPKRVHRFGKKGAHLYDTETVTKCVTYL